MIRLLIAALLLQTELPPHVLNQARILRRMATELKQLPDYTCLETIDRYTTPERGKLKLFDRILINVAIVGGRELYAKPGAASFDERGLAAIVGYGFISDGDFSVMARNIFVNKAAQLTFNGAETIGGRPTLRYDFNIPQMRSGWQLKARGVGGVVGATGSFWADAETFDLVRLRYSADDLPPWSSQKSIEEDVSYMRVSVGTASVLLPAAVDLRSELFDGGRYWNHTAFSQCRRYSSDSAISFENVIN